MSAEGFVDARHPRTIVGRDADGFIWLVVVDGRQAEAGGMTFAELQAGLPNLTQSLFDYIDAAQCLFIAGSNMAIAHPVLYRRVEVPSRNLKL